MALEGKQPPGRVPHFELVFYLTMESLGKVHPTHRNYHQWDQMSEREKAAQRYDIAELYVAIARKYEHSAIFFHGAGGWKEESETLRTLELIRVLAGMDYFLMMHGDATYGVPSGTTMVDFSVQMVEQPQKLKDDAERMVDQALERGERLKKHGVLDGFALCSDYCFNTGPFLSPPLFDEFVTPYLTRLTTEYRRMGYYIIKHTDGNIMPILDSLVSSQPHALHSLDPQGDVDIAEVKRRVGDKVCLIGNVNCGLMDTGTEDEVVDSVRYALKHGMPGGGYALSTSNCVYTGMDLSRYELMLDVWRREGNYDGARPSTVLPSD